MIKLFSGLELTNCSAVLLFIDKCHKQHAIKPVELETKNNVGVVAVAYKTEVSRIATDVELTNNFSNKLQREIPRVAVDLVNTS